MHTLPVSIYKITHQLLHMPKRKQAAYRTNNFSNSNFFFLVLCKRLTSFKSNTAKSKLFILQREHFTEKHNKRTAGTNIYKVLCPALIVHHVFSVPLDKFSKRLLSSASSLYFRLASLSFFPPSDSLIQIQLAVEGAGAFWLCPGILG